MEDICNSEKLKLDEFIDCFKPVEFKQFTDILQKDQELAKFFASRKKDEDE